MADTKSSVRRLGETKGRLAEVDVTRGDRELADAKSLDNRSLPKRNEAEHARPGLPCGNVADANGLRRRPESDNQLTSEQSNQAISYLPYFAPGPNDRRWAEIIEEYPSLKPALCSMANGVANRVDELRAAGNGVCPMAGAIAWLSLSANFE